MTAPSLPTEGQPGVLADKLTIETPEQTALEFAVAGLGSRFLAMALDTLFQVVGYTILVLLAVLLVRAIPGLMMREGTWIAAIVLFAIFAVYYGYFIFFEAVWNGQTPGKRLIHLRVIKDDGRPIHVTESFARNLLRIVDQFPFLYPVGIASILLSKHSKRLGDFVAGTIVVHERTLEEIKPLWQAPAPAAAAQRLGSERLSGEELSLIETFLNRREALDPYVRYQMAEKILQRIGSKIPRPEGATLSNEKLLEALAAERRASARFT